MGRSVAQAFLNHAADQIALGVRAGKLPASANEWANQQARPWGGGRRMRWLGAARDASQDTCGTDGARSIACVAVAAASERRGAYVGGLSPCFPASRLSSPTAAQVGRMLASYRRYTDEELMQAYQTYSTVLKAFIKGE